jgi:hypothetical protein
VTTGSNRFLTTAQVNLAIFRRKPSENFVAVVPGCAASNQDKRRSLLGYFEKSAKKEGKKEKKVVKEKKEKKVEKKEAKQEKKEVKKAEEQLENQQAAQGIAQAKPVFVVKKFEEEKPWRRNLLGYLKKEKKEKKNVEVKKVEEQPENQQAAQGIAQAKPVFVVKKVKEEKPWRRSLLGYFTGKGEKKVKKEKKEVKEEKEVEKPEVKKEKKVKVGKKAEEKPKEDVGPALLFSGGINQAQQGMCGEKGLFAWYLVLLRLCRRTKLLIDYIDNILFRTSPKHRTSVGLL